MSRIQIYDKILCAKADKNKLFAVLIDPDKFDTNKSLLFVNEALQSKVDFFFIGGSLMLSNQLDDCVRSIRAACDIPIVLFPGSTQQLCDEADAILFLSLISGRNADLLIGNHVIAAPYLKQSSLEILPTGYMLIDGGRPTTVSYISGTLPIPADKPDIAACTAVAGEMLGLRLLFMDAGSGAQQCVSEEMVATVRNQVDIPIIVGGGIRSAAQAAKLAAAGADIIVVGNAIEANPELIQSISAAIHQCHSSIV